MFKDAFICYLLFSLHNYSMQLCFIVTLYRYSHYIESRNVILTHLNHFFNILSYLIMLQQRPTEHAQNIVVIVNTLIVSFYLTSLFF